ncbi:MAG: amino acid racemase [Candidatus Micrarchaeaceae archaeon]|jgi:aspartate racemase
MKTIGILGGMGPAATVELLNRIIFLCQRKYKAVQDSEYPQIAIYSMAPKGSDETGIKNEKLLQKEFIIGSNKLSKVGCDFVILPCNTAHYFMAKIKKQTRIPVLSMTDETVSIVKKSKLKKVGLLASQSSYDHNIYGDILASKGIKLILPNNGERRNITNIILRIMAGNLDKKDKTTLKEIIKQMEKREQIQAIIIGCTELSIILKVNECPIKAFDSLDILAENAVIKAYKS